MKKIIVTLALMLSVSFAFANEVKIEKKAESVTTNIENTSKIATLEVEIESISNLKDQSNFSFEKKFYFGKCHIKIYDSEGNLVYEAVLPANTPEACKKLLKDTLDAMQ